MENFQEGPFGDEKLLARREPEGESLLEKSGPLTGNDTSQQNQQDLDEAMLAEIEKMGAEDPIDYDSHSFSQNLNPADEIEVSQGFIDEVTESQPRGEYSQPSQSADYKSFLSRSHGDLDDHNQHSQVQFGSSNAFNDQEDEGQVKVETPSPARAREFENTAARQATLSPSPDVKEEPQSPLGRDKTLGQIDGERQNMTVLPTSEKSSEQSRAFPASGKSKEGDEDEIKDEVNDEIKFKAKDKINEDSKTGGKEDDEDEFFDASEDSSSNAGKVDQGTSHVQNSNAQKVKPSSQSLGSELSGNEQLSKNSQQTIQPTVTNVADSLNLLKSFVSDAIAPSGSTINGLLEASRLGCSFASSAHEGEVDQTEPELMDSAGVQVSEYELEEGFLESDDGLELKGGDQFLDTSSPRTKVDAGLDEGNSTSSPRSHGVETVMKAAFPSAPPPSEQKPESKEDFHGNLELSSKRGSASKSTSASAIFTPTIPIHIPDDEEHADIKDQKSPFKTARKHPNNKSKTVKSNAKIADSDSQDESARVSESQKKANDKTQSKSQGRQKKPQEVNNERDLTNLKSATHKKQSANKTVAGDQVPATKSTEPKKEIETIDLDPDEETPEPAKVTKLNAGNLDADTSQQISSERQKPNTHRNGDAENEDRTSAPPSRAQVIIHSENTAHRGGSIDLTMSEDDSSEDSDQQRNFTDEPKKKAKPATTRKRPNQSAVDTKPAKKAKIAPPKATRGKNITPSLHDDDAVHITSVKSTKMLKPIAKPIGGFPRFDDGDVYISLSAEDTTRTYRLHSQTLSKVSEYFKNQLKLEVGEPFPELKKTIKPLRTRFDARIKPKTNSLFLKRFAFTMNQEELKTLALKNSKPQHYDLDECLQKDDQNQNEDSKSGMDLILAQIEANRKQRKERFYDSMDNLLRAYYKMPLKLNMENVEFAFEQCEGLLELADDFKSSDFSSILSKLKEHMADYFQLDLYRAIAQDPPRWLSLSMKLHSPPIFKESMMHIVGNYPQWQEAATEAVGNYPGVVRYINIMVKSFKTLKNDIDQHLLRENHFGVGEAEIVEMIEPTFFSVQEPDYNTYLVNVAWKDWYAHSLQEADKVRRSRSHEDASMYRKITLGGESFMSSDEICDRLEKIRNCQLSAVEVKDIRITLAAIKDYAQKKVQPLCTNLSMLNLEEEDIAHFMCVKVSNEELPWST